MAHDITDTIKTGLGLMIIGGTGILTGLKRMRRLRAIQDTPTHNIRSAPQGLVEIQGHALPYTTPFSSIKGIPAVHRQFEIQERRRSGKSERWETVLKEIEGDRFIISDGTGIAYVDVQGAEFELTRTTLSWGKIRPKIQEQIVARYGHRVSGLKVSGGGFFSSLFSKELRAVEQALFECAPVYVRGSFIGDRNLTPYTIAPHYLRFLGALAGLRERPGGRRRTFDLNRDGKIDEAELNAGSLNLLVRARAEVESGETPEQVAFQGFFTHDPTHGLLIGDCHQEQLGNRLTGWNLMRVVGGSAAVAVGVWILLRGL